MQQASGQRQEKTGRGISLGTKTLLIATITFLGVFALIYLTLEPMVMGAFAREETKDTSDKVEIALAAVTNELSDLGNLTAEWAKWDDTYAFMEKANPNYIKSNLADGTLVNNRLNLIVYVRPSGEILFSKAYDMIAATQIPIPADLGEHLHPDSPLLRDLGREGGKGGF